MPRRDNWIYNTRFTEENHKNIDHIMQNKGGYKSYNDYINQAVNKLIKSDLKKIEKVGKNG